MFATCQFILFKMAYNSLTDTGIYMHMYAAHTAVFEAEDAQCGKVLAIH